MYKILTNPINVIEDRFTNIRTLLYNNHIKPHQVMEISLGIDNQEHAYLMELVFHEYVGYKSNAFPTVYKIGFPIVTTDAFTVESAKIARKIFKKYCEEDEEIISNYVNKAWRDYKIKYEIVTKLPAEFAEYFNQEELEAIQKEQFN